MADGDAVKRYLERVISDLDAGRAPRRGGLEAWARALALPAAVGLSMGLATCAQPHARQVDKDDVAEAAAAGTLDDICDLLDAEPGCDPCEELGFYGDGVCDDFCPGYDPACDTPLYGVPFEEDCADGADDDGDGLADCCDDDCDGAAECIPSCPRYAAPLSETDCANCVDDDCDGLVDDLDSDCIGHPLYGVPF